MLIVEITHIFIIRVFSTIINAIVESHMIDMDDSTKQIATPHAEPQLTCVVVETLTAFCTVSLLNSSYSVSFYSLLLIHFLKRISVEIKVRIGYDRIYFQQTKD